LFLIYRPSYNKNYVIALEASGGTFDAAAKLESYGHEVLLVNPSQFKAIGLNGKKSDKRDAKAIATALRMGFIPEVRKKNLYSRQLKALIKSRDFVVKSRTSLICHIRGILREFGLVMPAGVENFYEQAVEKVQALECVQIRHTLLVLLEQVGELKTQEQMIEKELKEITKEDVRIANLQTIPGVGLVTAVAFASTIEDAKYFSDANKVASYLGLVPREFSSGDKVRFGGITKSGSEITRRYLIHGARTYMRYVNRDNKDNTRRWAARIKDKSGMNKAVVAVAHKTAKVMYAVLRDGTIYRGKKAA
jgi:transposase